MRKEAQIIFQDPYSSLNPRMTVYDLISAPLEVYKVGTKEERREMVEEILQEVGLDKQYLNRFPHEFSGGQRQRIGIARALILNPEFVVCDEAVSALDVSVRAQVLNLMEKYAAEEKSDLPVYLHDLSVVRHISDRIAVMYLGNIVEVIPGEDVAKNSLHPYTQALLGAQFSIHMDQHKKIESIESEAPSPLDVPHGCPFQNRCEHCMEKCKTTRPVLKEMEAGHEVACHYVT